MASPSGRRCLCAGADAATPGPTPASMVCCWTNGPNCHNVHFPPWLSSKKREVDNWALQRAFSLECAHIHILLQHSGVRLAKTTNLPVFIDLSWTCCQPVLSSTHGITLGICPCSGRRTGTQCTQTKPSISTKHNPKSRSDPLPHALPSLHQPCGVVKAEQAAVKQGWVPWNIQPSW